MPNVTWGSVDEEDYGVFFNGALLYAPLGSSEDAARLCDAINSHVDNILCEDGVQRVYEEDEIE